MNSIVTVTGAAADIDLTDLAAVKARLGITGTTEDAQLQAMISEASAFIASYCRRVFVKETVSEQIRVDAAVHRLLLTRFPVVAITSITSGDTALVAADWEVDSEKGILYRLADTSYMDWGESRTTIVYEAGYADADIPADLAGACISLLTLKRSAASRDPLAKRIEIPDVRTVDYWVGSVAGVNSSSGLPPDIQGVLDTYRNFNL